ncbi:zinc ribbon domain-containing protein [Metabacillus sp. KIGAM252]|uniref:Zinc ribbon domain-containing protein n=1 Tax=Metabacillus flavus TaxID=2823519 RepID=A0ABS5LJF9_9BACI|nr:zinc ribbon domain-containing protein [Metabacillus flavus]
MYSTYWGTPLYSTAIEPPASKKSFLSAIKPVMPSSCFCDKCGSQADVRICPSCHSNLPSTIADYEDYIIAVIGAKQTGKSHYISVLIDSIQNSIGSAYNCFLKPENDDTIRRYNTNFRDPLFKHKTTLEVTSSATGTDADVKKPLLYTLSFSGEGIFGTKVITLALFDTAGEDLKDEKIMAQHVRYISHSAGVICLLDPLQLESVRDQIHEKGLPVNLPRLDNENSVNDLLNRTTNMIRNLLKMKVSKKIEIPMALSFSKMDAIKPLLDPGSKLHQPSRHTDQRGFDTVDFEGVSNEMKALVQGWTQGNLTNLLEHNYKHYAFFGLSALGMDPGTDSRVEKIEPFRVEDPFLWLLWKNQIIKSHMRKG